MGSLFVVVAEILHHDSSPVLLGDKISPGRTMQSPQALVLSGLGQTEFLFSQYIDFLSYIVHSITGVFPLSVPFLWGYMATMKFRVHMNVRPSIVIIAICCPTGVKLYFPPAAIVYREPVPVPRWSEITAGKGSKGDWPASIDV